jgi:hypothetical protein
VLATRPSRPVVDGGQQGVDEQRLERELARRDGSPPPVTVHDEPRPRMQHEVAEIDGARPRTPRGSERARSGGKSRCETTDRERRVHGCVGAAKRAVGSGPAA